MTLYYETWGGVEIIFYKTDFVFKRMIFSFPLQKLNHLFFITIAKIFIKSIKLFFKALRPPTVELDNAHSYFWLTVF